MWAYTKKQGYFLTSNKKRNYFAAEIDSHFSINSVQLKVLTLPSLSLLPHSSDPLITIVPHYVMCQQVLLLFCYNQR